MGSNICKTGIATDDVVKVLGPLGLSRLYHGKNPTKQHFLAIELVNVLVCSCAPSLICIAVVDTLTLSQLTRFTGSAFVALPLSQ